MQRLTREKCEELKEAGYGQSLNFGDWYYAVEDDPSVHIGSDGFVSDDCLKCPSTGELKRAIIDLTHGGVRSVVYSGSTDVEAKDIHVSLNYCDEDTALAELWMKLQEVK
jgi:hypothetical protein